MSSAARRVLVLTTSYPLRPGSVAGLFVARLADALARECRVTVLTADDCLQPAADSEVGRFRYAPRPLQVLAQQPGGIPVALRGNRLRWLLVPGFLLAMFLATLRRAGSADIIQANWAICGVVAGVAGRLRGVPVVLTVRGEDVGRAGARRAGPGVLGTAVGLASAVVAVGDDIHGELATTFPAAAGKLHMIANGVDDALLALPLPRPARADDAVRVLCVGSLIPRKALADVIEALADSGLEATSLALVGDGPERARLVALAGERGLAQRLQLPGVLTGTELQRCYHDADIFVLSSHSEGRANVLVEAMAAGLAVIASRVRGTGELVEDGHSGLVYEPGDTRALAGCLARLGADPALRRRLGEAARARVRALGLTWDNTATRYARLFDVVCGGA